MVNRGYVPQDVRQFGAEQIRRLQTAQQDIVYLLDRHYPMRQTVTFVGNRFQFSARQRTALMRASCSSACLRSRKAREARGPLPGGTIYIDGFNLVITLETALSGSTLLFCMDGCVRDLCGLHGSYRLIDKTDEAVRLIVRRLECLGIETAVFLLDRQISNSGRLKQRIMGLSQGHGIHIEVLLTDHADALLMKKPAVATTDSEILDPCNKWVNLVHPILKSASLQVAPVNLSCGLIW